MGDIKYIKPTYPKVGNSYEELGELPEDICDFEKLKISDNNHQRPSIEISLE